MAKAAKRAKTSKTAKGSRAKKAAKGAKGTSSATRRTGAKTSRAAGTRAKGAKAAKAAKGTRAKKTAKSAKGTRSTAKAPGAKPGGVAKTTDVADYVAQQTGMGMRESREAVKAAFEGVARLLKKNERVTLTGVGSFSKTVKPAQRGGKKATNPFTGEPYVTKSKPASTKVKFRPGKGFKEHVGK